MNSRWSNLAIIPESSPDLDSHARERFDWSSLGLPHPDSPTGERFSWSSIGLHHPHSPTADRFDWSSLGLHHPHSVAAWRFDRLLLNVIPKSLVQDSHSCDNSSGIAQTTSARRHRLNYLKSVISESFSKNNYQLWTDYFTALFIEAVGLLDFSTKKDEGVLYSGKVQGRFGSYMSTHAKQYSAQHSKRPLVFTEGGAWLNDFEPISAKLGTKSADIIWQMASISYVNLLRGDVIIFLANPEYHSIFRRPIYGEGGALYRNPNVQRILYVIEHSAPNFDQPKMAPNERAWFFPSVKQLDDFLKSGLKS